MKQQCTLSALATVILVSIASTTHAFSEHTIKGMFCDTLADAIKNSGSTSHALKRQLQHVSPEMKSVYTVVLNTAYNTALNMTGNNSIRRPVNSQAALDAVTKKYGNGSSLCEAAHNALSGCTHVPMPKKTLTFDDVHSLVIHSAHRKACASRTINSRSGKAPVILPITDPAR